MENNNQGKIQSVFKRLVRPLAKMMLKQNISVAAASLMLKESFIEAAESRLEDEGSRATNAKIAVITGLDRNEVSRIRRGVDRKGQPLSIEGENPQLNRAARVITNWPKKDGQPLDLGYSGDNSFAELVRNYSGGIPAQSILDELLRSKLVIQLPSGLIRLLGDSFVPANNTSKLDVSSTQVARLLDTIDHNTTMGHENKPSLQLELLFPGLSDEVVEHFRTLSRTEAVKLLHALSDKIKKEREKETRSKDQVAELNEQRKTGLGLYFFDITED